MREKRQAFTLVELVVALALFAFAAVGFAQVIVNSLQARASIPDQRGGPDGLTQARRQLQQMDRGTLEQGGTRDVKEGVLSWEAEVEPTNVLGLFRVDAKASLSREAEAATPQLLVFYVHRPQWLSNEERQPLIENKKTFLAEVRQ